MLSNAYFLAKFRFGTAENEPAKILQFFPKFSKILLFLNPESGRRRRRRRRRHQRGAQLRRARRVRSVRKRVASVLPRGVAARVVSLQHGRLRGHPRHVMPERLDDG